MRKKNLLPKKSTKESIGQTIHLLRKASRTSQEELGKLLKLHQTAVCRVENGQQNLRPDHIEKIAGYFGVKVDKVFSGKINYWQVAERFHRAPRIPERYQEHPYSRVRETLPTLEFIRLIKGSGLDADNYIDTLLSSLEISRIMLSDPEQPIGVNCNLDFLRHLITRGMLDETRLKTLADQARTEATQDFLHPLYLTQVDSINLIQSWVLNSHHYETNFKYLPIPRGANALELLISPNEHMSEIEYKDDVLGDILCQYKKKYFENFPKYINKEPLQVEEKECHFHGAEKCVYILKKAG